MCPDCRRSANVLFLAVDAIAMLMLPSQPSMLETSCSCFAFTFLVASSSHLFLLEFLLCVSFAKLVGISSQVCDKRQSMRMIRCRVRNRIGHNTGKQCVGA